MNKHMYILADGGRIAASDPSEFVRVLREGSWFDSECTDGEYMVNFSGRYRELHGVTVRTDTPEHFMDDLKQYGYITGGEARSFIIAIPAGTLQRPAGIFLFSRYRISAVSRFPKGGWLHASLRESLFFLFTAPSAMTKTDYP